MPWVFGGGVGPLVCAVSESPLRLQIFFGQILNSIHLIIHIAIWMDTEMCCHLLFVDFLSFSFLMQSLTR
jgi:hypothetical protein